LLGQGSTNVNFSLGDHIEAGSPFCREPALGELAPEPINRRCYRALRLPPLAPGQTSFLSGKLWVRRWDSASYIAKNNFNSL
jgi:hypothetical protein